jgi:hypothetical protein
LGPRQHDKHAGCVLELEDFFNETITAISEATIKL